MRARRHRCCPVAVSVSRAQGELDETVLEALSRDAHVGVDVPDILLATRRVTGRNQQHTTDQNRNH